MTPMLTKRGLAVRGRTGYMVTITLPFAEQSQFSPLARQARLHPDLASVVSSAA